MVDTYRVIYRGRAPFASMLAQMLEEEGADVDWEPPEERRNTNDALQEIIISLVATGAYEAIKYAIQRFREVAKGRGDARIEGDPDDGGFF